MGLRFNIQCEFLVVSIFPPEWKGRGALIKTLNLVPGAPMVMSTAAIDNRKFRRDSRLNTQSHIFQRPTKFWQSCPLFGESLPSGIPIVKKEYCEAAVDL